MHNPYDMTPNILKETSAGHIQYPIRDAMFCDREVECIGEITPELVNSLILQLRYLQKRILKRLHLKK